jgi:5-methyltetrahydrofolate--homocysteine methyltransferase
VCTTNSKECGDCIEGYQALSVQIKYCMRYINFKKKVTMGILEDIKKGVIDMKVEETAELTKKALDEGLKPERVLKEALIPAMNLVGDEYERGERFVPEMFLSADSMKGAVEILRPLLVGSGIEPAGKVVMGTVKGDLHDIGQNLVCMMLEGAGFEVHNLGVEVPAERFVEAVKEVGAHLVGISALLTTTMVHMHGVIEALKRAGLRKQVKVMVGGAPVTNDYADKIGADGYGPDASAAVKLAKELMTQLKS